MKANERKTRPDSPLRNLPEERQAAIMAMLTPGPEAKSLAAVRKQLADDGLKCSENALSKFRSWYLLREQLQQNAEDAETFMEELRKDHPDLAEESIFKRGQQVFSLLAIKTESALDWARIQKLRQNDERTALEARRIAVLEKKALQADAADEVVNSKLTPAQKEQKLKAIFGIA